MISYKIILKKNNGNISVVNYKSDLQEEELRKHLDKKKYIKVANSVFNVAAWDSYEIEK